VASPPPAPDPPPSAVTRLAGALAVLGGTPRILGLVWGAHPPTAAVVLEDGRIEEQGTHADLYVRQASRYR
jgi:hypothetical protein